MMMMMWWNARSRNGRLVVGGLHSDVLVVFGQSHWFFTGSGAAHVCVDAYFYEDDH